MNEAWIKLLIDLLATGDTVAPRGMLTRELPQSTVRIPMRRPVLTIPERKLSYQFMAAEAFWILSGDDTVAGIAPWNKNIARFSDDGQTFFGAYGPKILDQLGCVVEKLQADPGTRQAGLTIWRENPTATKDVPCTVAIFAQLRSGQLNLHIFMRSSDAWLGLPYDAFNFSMLAHLICCRLNRVHLKTSGNPIRPGMLFLTAASSHLYEQHFAPAAECITAHEVVIERGQQTPSMLYLDEDTLFYMLKTLRDSKPGDDQRWWE